MSQKISIITPAYNEAENLPVLYERIAVVMDQLSIDWEWIIVDDHSVDGTFQTIQVLSGRDSGIRGFRFSRNFGSHAAISCGIHHATGDCCVVLAGDMQDPPEVIPQLVEAWQDDNHVVWAVRADGSTVAQGNRLFPRFYYWIMRRMVGISNMPGNGADFFLLDRRVIDAYSRFGERNVSILVLISWMGFRQQQIVYDKHERLHGVTGWTLGKKLKLVLDSIASFSYFPIRAMSTLGVATALLGFLYALVIFYNALVGQPNEGWSSIMLVVLVLGGLQMMMLGTLGEYLWRTLEEGKQRPTYLIEDSIGAEEPSLKEPE